VNCTFYLCDKKQQLTWR